MIPREEMIDCQSWYGLADYHYTTGMTDLPSGIVHCDLASIPEFFAAIAFNFNKKYVVISSRCDFGLHYQEHYPPWRDYVKLVGQCVGPSNSGGGYADIRLPPTVNLNRCRQTDKYSIKCYRYTEATFDSIPGNVVKWFVVNNTILDDGRIVSIPFGINGVDGSKEAGDKIFARSHKIFDWEKNTVYRSTRYKELYVNFAFYTVERARLYALYSQDSFTTCEQNKDYDSFLDQLEIHNCVLCPPGNGWDCYRTLEAIYMGCIPVVEDNVAMRVYANMGMPCVFVTSLEVISLAVLKEIRNAWLSDRTLWNLDGAKLSYWKKLIEESRGLI